MTRRQFTTSFAVEIVYGLVSGVLYNSMETLYPLFSHQGGFNSCCNVALTIHQGKLLPPGGGTEEQDPSSSSTMAVHFRGPPDLPQNRTDRFPSVEQRIQLYMSNWYQPPCSNQTKMSYVIERDHASFPTLRYTGPANDRTKVYESKVQPDVKLLLEDETIADCARSMAEWEQQEKRPRTEGRIFHRRPMVWYCQDAMEMLNITKDLSARAILASPEAFYPIILQMGDIPTLSTSVPVIAKYRSSMSRDNLHRVTDLSTCSNRLSATGTAPVHENPTDGFFPIIWNLNSERHFGPHLRATRSHDIPWHDKRNGTLWRGAMTGFMEQRPDATPLDQCLSNTRCRFVYESRQRNSTLIDARLSWIPPEYSGGVYCNGFSLEANQTDFQEFLQYKVIISLEGNDVSSGLKWNLLSNSVVLMPAPTKTSWAMEELLEPWVHYVPIHANLSNVEDQIRWVLANDESAKRIAERATLFMEDLWFSDDAKKDDLAVKYGILERYRKYWH
jgi:Glycosyl transferase family 90